MIVETPRIPLTNDYLIMFTKVPVVKDIGVLVTVLTVLSVDVVKVAGVLVVSATRTHTQLHYSSSWSSSSCGLSNRTLPSRWACSMPVQWNRAAHQDHKSWRSFERVQIISVTTVKSVIVVINENPVFIRLVGRIDITDQ